VYLKKVRMVGFKSFADRAELIFGPGISIIVGPNGSGKSNIADAIRWCLGEQSARTLRGARMEDVIFAGSDSRRPHSMAEVTLVFDNSDGFLPLDYTEVSITRRIYRDNQSEFLIGSQPCRLKDVQQLFMDTGVGKHAYSFVGQGQVEQVLSASPQERRLLIEEAAGISGYRQRKREALRKLTETEANLVRVGDLLAELKRQLEPLAEKAARAERYRCLRERADQLALALHGERVRELDRTLETLRGRLNRARRRLGDSRARVEEAEERVAAVRRRRDELWQHIERVRGRLHEISTRLERAEERLQALRDRRHQLEHRRAELEELLRRTLHDIRETEVALRDGRGRLEDYERQAREAEVARIAARARLSQATSDLQCAERCLDRLKTEMFDLHNKVAGCRNRLAVLQVQEDRARRDLARARQTGGTAARRLEDLDKARGELQVRLAEQESLLERQRARLDRLQQGRERLETRARELAQELEDHHRQVAALEAELEVLEAARSSHRGYPEAVERILRALGDQLQGVTVLGVLGEALHPRAHMASLLAAALGEAQEWLVVRSLQDAVRLIAWGNQRQLGGYGVLCLDQIPEDAPELPAELAGEGAPVWARKAAGFLLAGVRMGEEWEPRRLLRLTQPAVTPEGHLARPPALLVPGAYRRWQETGVLRSARITRIAGQLEAARKRLETLASRLSRVRRAREEIERRLDSSRRELARLELTRGELVRRSTQLQKQYRAVRRQVEAARAEEEEIKGLLDDCRRAQREEAGRLQELERRQREHQALIEAAEERVRQAQAELEAAREALTEVRVMEARLGEQVLAARQTLRSQEERRRELEARQQGAREQHRKVLEALERLEAEWTDLQRQISEWHGEWETAQAEATRAQNDQKSLDGQLADASTQLERSRREANAWRERVHHLEKEEQRFRLQLDAVGVRLRDRWGVTLEEARATQLPAPVEEVHRQLEALEQELAALGEVDPGAAVEHRRLRERIRFLESQAEDLARARRDLERIIRETDRQIDRLFRETYQAARRHFREIFRELFGGGQADLVLIPGEDPLETGVDIVAQPPGRKLQSLTLLSGGEKALTAIALLFALLRVKPSPFCVLDEIEAALDEANIERFIKFLRSLADRVQFIIVTHQKPTMEAADALYGVTMEESGVSKLVSIKLTGGSQVAT